MPAIVAVYCHFVGRTVGEFVAIHRIGQEYAPHTAFATMQFQFATSPIVEIAKQIDLLGRGQPLAEPPARKKFVALPAIISVAIGIIDDRPCGALDLEHLIDIQLVSMDQFALDRL